MDPLSGERRLWLEGEDVAHGRVDFAVDHVSVDLLHRCWPARVNHFHPLVDRWNEGTPGDFIALAELAGPPVLSALLEPLREEEELRIGSAERLSCIAGIPVRGAEDDVALQVLAEVGS